MSQQKMIVVLGSTSVGKSALTLKYIRDEFPEYYNPTIISTYKKLGVTATHSNTKYDLTVYDTAGLEQQSEIQTQYENANGFILVYSITDRQSFDIVKDIFEKLKEIGANIPTLLIGNKIDLQDKRRISSEEGRKLAKEMHAEFLETSAKLNNNVQDAFITIVNAIDRLSNQHQQQRNNNNSHHNVNNTSNFNNNNLPSKNHINAKLNSSTNNSKNASCIIT